MNIIGCVALHNKNGQWKLMEESSRIFGWFRWVKLYILKG